MIGIAFCLFLIVNANIVKGQPNNAIFWGLFEDNIKKNTSQVDAYGANSIRKQNTFTIKLSKLAELMRYGCGA
jgi:hypothetical protein